MYIPESFRVVSRAKLFSFIRANSFGLLVTGGERGLGGTHIPFIIDEEWKDAGRLVGHVAKKNEQWRDMDGREALAVFRGPDAYISPAWYDEPNVVPTWNYVAVHVRGTMRLAHDDDVLPILRSLVDTYESSSVNGWSIDEEDPVFIGTLSKSVVGFYIEICEIQGQWKLSQNHTLARRRRVIQKLRERGCADDNRVAELMEQAIADFPRPDQVV